MKKLLLLISFAVSTQFASYAQEQQQSSVVAPQNAEVVKPASENSEDMVKPKNGGKVKLKPYGFVRNYYFYDSRQITQSNAGLSNRIPKDELWNEAGDEDLNAVSQSSFLAISTRFGLNLSGLRVLNADVTAKAEGDFCGFSSSNTMIRLRHAYGKLQWQHNALLIGQTYTPFFAEYSPEVLSHAAGSPFQPESRSPQIRYEGSVDDWKFTAAAVWQFQYQSWGPDGKSSKYQLYAHVPEFVIGFDYKNDRGFTIGAGVDISTIRPRTQYETSYTVGVIKDTIWNADKSGYDRIEERDSTIKTKRLVKELFTSASPMFFIDYKNKENTFHILFKSIYGQNVAHFNMYSGYGVSKINEDGTQEYKPLRSLTNFVDLSWGKKFRGNFFAGYMKNFGASEDFVGDIYTLDKIKNIDYLWRVSPAISYTVSKFTFGLEYELTGVGYGDNVESNGSVKADRDVLNHRASAMIKFAW